MGIKVKVNLSGLERRFSRENLIRARKASANDAHQAMERYVPMLHPDSNTNLRNMSFVTDDGKTIKYTAVYAKAQFYGFITNAHGGPYRIHNYTTPGTSRRWDLRLKGNKEDMKKVKDAFIKGLKWENHAD